jgi:AraC family transcriptional regulator
MRDRGGDGAIRNGARAQGAAVRSAAIERVIEAMRQRLNGPFPLEEMASLAYLSPYYFNRVFRQVTGVPPRRFRTALRMAAAKRLLLTTDQSVTEICLELGYQSLGTFTTHFRELVGVSPSGLRRLAEDPSECAPVDLVAALERQTTGSAWRSAPIGRVTGPAAASEWLVFIGAFAGRCPQGAPAACTARIGPGEFRFASPVGPRRHVAVVTIPSSDDPRAYLVPEENELLVASAPARIALSPIPGAARELRLRTPCSTDPPVLLALPMLLARRVVGRDMLDVV